MAKVLNLDALGKKEVREIVIGGKTHAVKQMSVGDFVNVTKLANKMESEKDPAKQLEASVGLLTLALPTVKKEDLMGLSMAQLTALGAFVRGEDPASIVESDTPAEESAEGK